MAEKIPVISHLPSAPGKGWNIAVNERTTAADIINIVSRAITLTVSQVSVYASFSGNEIELQLFEPVLQYYRNWCQQEIVGRFILKEKSAPIDSGESLLQKIQQPIYRDTNFTSTERARPRGINTTNTYSGPSSNFEKVNIYSPVPPSSPQHMSDRTSVLTGSPMIRRDIPGSAQPNAEREKHTTQLQLINEKCKVLLEKKRKIQELLNGFQNQLVEAEDADTIQYCNEQIAKAESGLQAIQQQLTGLFSHKTRIQEALKASQVAQAAPSPAPIPANIQPAPAQTFANEQAQFNANPLYRENKVAANIKNQFSANTTVLQPANQLPQPISPLGGLSKHSSLLSVSLPSIQNASANQVKPLAPSAPGPTPSSPTPIRSSSVILPTPQFSQPIGNLPSQSTPQAPATSARPQSPQHNEPMIDPSFTPPEIIVQKSFFIPQPGVENDIVFPQAIINQIANDFQKISNDRYKSTFDQLLLLLKRSEQSDLQDKALKYLISLCPNPQNQKLLLQSNYIFTILELLENNQKNSVRKLSSWVVGHLSILEENKEIIVKAGGLPALIQLLYSDSDTCVEQATVALANILNSKNIAFKQIFRNVNGFAHVLHVLLHAKGELRVTNALKLLALLGLPVDDRKALIETPGAILSILNAIEYDSLHPKKLSAMILATLSTNLQARDIIREFNGLKIIINLLKTPDKTVIEKTILIINNLALDGKNLNEIEKLGGIELIMRLMKHADVKISSKAIRCLSNLIIDEENLQKLFSLNPVGTLIELLSSDNEEILNSTIRTIVNLTHNSPIADSVRNQFGAKGIIKHLTQILAKTAASPLNPASVNGVNSNDELIEQSLKAFVNLSLSYVDEDEYIQSKAIELLVDTYLASNKLDHRIIDLAAATIVNLSKKGDKIRDKIRVIDGLNKIVNLCTSSQVSTQIYACKAITNLSMNGRNRFYLKNRSTAWNILYSFKFSEDQELIDASQQACRNLSFPCEDYESTQEEEGKGKEGMGQDTSMIDALIKVVELEAEQQAENIETPISKETVFQQLRNSKVVSASVEDKEPATIQSVDKIKNQKDGGESTDEEDEVDQFFEAMTEDPDSRIQKLQDEEDRIKQAEKKLEQLRMIEDEKIKEAQEDLEKHKIEIRKSLYQSKTSPPAPIRLDDDTDMAELLSLVDDLLEDSPSTPATTTINPEQMQEVEQKEAKIEELRKDKDRILEEQRRLLEEERSKFNEERIKFELELSTLRSLNKKKPSTAKKVDRKVKPKKKKGSGTMRKENQLHLDLPLSSSPTAPLPGTSLLFRYFFFFSFFFLLFFLLFSHLIFFLVLFISSFDF